MSITNLGDNGALSEIITEWVLTLCYSNILPQSVGKHGILKYQISAG